MVITNEVNNNMNKIGKSELLRVKEWIYVLSSYASMSTTQFI